MSEISKVRAAALAREKHLQQPNSTTKDNKQQSATTSKKQKLDYDLVHSLHELITLENSMEEDGASLEDYKKKTKALLQKLLLKLEQSVSANQLLEQQLRMKDEQLQAVQRELEMSRDLFAREQRAHRFVTETNKKDLQRAENFLRRLGSQLETLNGNFRVLDEEEMAEEAVEETAGQSEWEFGDCDIDSNVDYSELLCEDDYDNDESQTPLVEEAKIEEREVLSHMTPSVSSRPRSSHNINNNNNRGKRKSCNFQPTTNHIQHTRSGRRSSFHHIGETDKGEEGNDEEYEVEKVEVVLLPGEEEADISHIPTSIRKKKHQRETDAHPPPPIQPLRRQSVVGATTTVGAVGKRRRSSLVGGLSKMKGQSRLSWVMPALLLATPEKSNNYDDQDIQDENANLNLQKTTMVMTPKVKTVGQDRWLRGIQNTTTTTELKFLSSQVPSRVGGRDGELTRRRMSLHTFSNQQDINVDNKDYVYEKHEQMTAQFSVNHARPALRLPSPLAHNHQ